MEPIQIIFLDLDGTLLGGDHKTVPRRTASALIAAHEAGIRLAVSTGRCRELLPAQVKALPFDYYITSNGADVYAAADGSHPIRMPLAASNASCAWRILKAHGFFVEWFADGGIAVDRAVYPTLTSEDMPCWHWDCLVSGRMGLLDSPEAYLAAGAPGLEKLNVVRCHDLGMRSQALAALEAAGGLELSYSLGRNIEVNQEGCTKGEAIRRLCRLLGLPLAQAAAFGDGNNDIEMLRTVGRGIAMGNALPAVRAAASRITATNELDGIALEVERWLA